MCRNGLDTARFGRVVVLDVVRIALEHGVVFRMQCHDADDLVFERLDRQGAPMLAPGLDIHASQIRAALVVEHRHQRVPRACGAGFASATGSVFALYSQRSTTGQTGHSGLRALQM